SLAPAASPKPSTAAITTAARTITPVLTSNTDPSAATEIITIPSTLVTTGAPPQMMVAVSGITGFTKAKFDIWLAAAAGKGATVISAIVGTPTKAAGPGNSWNFPVAWKVGPNVGTATNPPLPIVSFDISYTAIFFP